MMGLSSAAGYWIGKSVGEDNLGEAKAFFKVSSLMAAAFAFFSLVVTCRFLGELAMIYTTNSEVIDVCRQIGVLAAFSVFVDNLGAFFQGPIRALGI
mmetsp:Transcript_8208/g.12589  ORF Transcript_8208/g.12589 Transcript_8208/m.12589 type:complete len:97 (-) Transcript_8208:227-517(-)